MTMLWGRTGQKGFPRERLGRRPAVLGFYAWQYSGCPMKAGNLSESEGSDAFWVPLYSSIYLRESHVQGNRFDLENPGFNLTDGEALEQLEFNLLWHHALRLDIEETHLPQKTLHNFRVRLMQHDGGRLAFQETTDRIIQALGIRTGKQRLDSTHIMSNIATLTRLGLFCETMRLFLRGLALGAPRASPCGSGGPPRALFEGRRRGDPLRGRPHGGGSATPFGLCPGPLPASGPVPWHDCCPAGGVPAAGAAAAGAVPCGQTPGRAPGGR